MTRIELNPEQVQVLSEVLDLHLGDLRAEISSTDSKDYREQLKQREAVLRSVRELIAPVGGGGAR